MQETLLGAAVAQELGAVAGQVDDGRGLPGAQPDQFRTHAAILSLAVTRRSTGEETYVPIVAGVP